MNAMEFSEILERCVERIQSGESLEQVMADYPAQAEQLRPMIELILELNTARRAEIPPQALSRSRARFLLEAHRQRQKSTSGGMSWWQHLTSIRFSGAFVGIATAAVLLIYSGLASAQSLPGDTLYPVKLAAEQISLNMPASPSVSLNRQESYDQRRAWEVEELLIQQREEEVYLVGYLNWTDADGWKIQGLLIDVPENLRQDALKLVGTYVTVHADALPGKHLTLEWVEARLYNFSGKLNEMKPDRWQVGDVWVFIQTDTSFNDDPTLESTVMVSAQRREDGTYFAVKIENRSVTRKDGQPPQVTPPDIESEGEKTIEDAPVKQPTAKKEERPEATKTLEATPVPENHSGEGSPTQKPTESKNYEERKPTATVSPVPTEKSDSTPRPTQHKD